MQRSAALRRRPKLTWRTWVGVALAAWLVVAESFAVAHQYDAAGHANGDACAVCVGAATFGAAAPATPLAIEPVVVAQSVAVAASAFVFTVVPARRYARGPPAVSFTF